jgi:hypothetical protein
MAMTLADKKAETISVINVLQTIKRLNGDLDEALKHYELELNEIKKSE